MHKLFEICSITLFLCAFCAFLWLKNTFIPFETCLLFSNGARPLTFSPLEVRRISLVHFLTGPSPFSLIPFHFYLGISTTVEKALQINPFMQNKPNFLDALINVTSFYTADYENKTSWTLGENKPNSKPIKANTNPIQTQSKPKQTQNKPNTKPNKANFRGKKMLLRLTINPRRKSLGYYADEIEATNAYDWEKAGNRINMKSAAGLLYFPDKSL